MKRMTLLIILGMLVGSWRPLSAEDLTGRIGISGIADAGFNLGSKPVRDTGHAAGSDFGGMVRIQGDRHWGVGFGYDNINLSGTRVQPIIASLLYSFTPDRKWSPIARLGGGVSDYNRDGRFSRVAGKAGLGLEYYFCRYFAAGPDLAYTYVDGRDRMPGPVHVLSAGLMATLFFGGPQAEQPVAQAAPPPPPPAAIVLSVTPAEASVGPSQTAPFNAAVANTANPGVQWSINPSVGSISPAGVYQAPAEITAPQTITVTAASQADPAKTASALVRLTPPAAPPQPVSIRMDILFDTGKDIIKPQYDSEVQKVADFMKTYPGAKAEIEGHTDNVGSPALNQALSQKRAEAVRKELIEKFGVAADRLSAKGYGDTKPVADNKTAEGRAQNRRVVATLSSAQAQ